MPANEGATTVPADIQNVELPEVDYLTPRQLADALKVPLQTVYEWNKARSTVSGPPRVRIGKSIRYSRDGVLQWLEQRAVGA
jgi:excisionase family DNA binding protein